MREQLQAAIDAARAAQQAVDIARDALHLTESADIELADTLIDIPDLDNCPAGLGNAVVTLKWRNFGRTVAKNVVIDFCVGIPNRNARTLFQPNPPVMIGPGQTSNYAFAPMHMIMNREDWISLADGTSELRVWGVLTYETVFGGRRLLKVGATWIRGTTAFRWDQYEASDTRRVG